MAIESAAHFRRLASAGLLVLIGMLSLGAVASAQKEPVTTSSIIPLQAPTTAMQIYKILNNPAGDTIFLDAAAGNGSLYQLKKGATTFQTITSAIDTSGTYFNEDMAIDAQGTLYITDRYGSDHLYRIPYDSAKGTYDFSASADNFGATVDGGFVGPSATGSNQGTQGIAFMDSPAKDGSGLLFVSQQGVNGIMVIPVSANGTIPVFPSGPDAGQPEFQFIITGLKTKIMPIQADVNGNVYFIEDPYDGGPSSRDTGVYFIPASAYTSCMAASFAGGMDAASNSTAIDPCLTGIGSVQRIDPGNTEKFNGMTLDAAGNVYVADQSDGYGGTRNGTFMIPNESGSPIGVTAASFNFEDAQLLTPSPDNANPLIDYRGFLWSPEGSANDWSPNGSGPIPGTANFVLWQLGTDNVGSTPVGTASATGTVFFNFSGSAASGTVTPASIVFSQPGGQTDFSAVATNPYPPTSTTTTPAVPCSAGPDPVTGVVATYLPYSYCEYWVALTPQGTNAVGDDSGQVSFLDSNGAIIGGSTAYLSGVGVGPAVALLTPSQQTPLATGLVTPAQVAGDSQGNTYVADPGLGKVLMFAAGSTTASAGTSIGTGLTAPTGVAVDGAGDVYIGDSGKVIEVPAVNGTLNTAASAQVVLQTGLGPNLNLAVDDAQNVYAADPSKGRVVRIYNPQMSMLIEGISTFGTFSKPTAVAVDDTGDLFVADGSNLDEINFWGGQTTITSSLAGPVTGLAVDPSGSVDVAQKNGIVRIPLEAGGLNFNDAASIDSGGVTAPSGLGLDGLGNLYVTAPSYNASSVGSSGAISTPVNTPSLLSLAGALVNFGIVSEFTTSDPTDVNVYNIGNAPLAFTGPDATSDPTFGGTDPLDYATQPDGQNPCDQTGATPIASATACQLGVTVTALEQGNTSATMQVLTDAVNAPTTNAELIAYSSDLLCRTQTTITLTPSSGLVYPGSTTVTSTTIPDPAFPCAQGGAPEGGNIVLTLAPQAKGSSETTQTGKLPASGQYTFTLPGLNGGSYVVFAGYKGDAVYGGSSSDRTFSFVVAQATPTITLSTPAGVAPVNGTYFVQQGSTTTLQATVSSTVGNPTGSVQFLNGTAPADPTQNPVTLNGSGVATFNTSNLAAGTYNLTAVYNSDVNFATVTSPEVTIVVIPPSALITASPAAVTTPAGTAVTSTLTVTGLEGYAPKLGVQLYCDATTLPQYSECTFDVPTVDLFDNPGVPQISHVTISSNIPVNIGELHTGSSPIAFAGLFGLGLLGLAFRRKAKFNRSAITLGCLLLLFGGAAMGLTGCTNSGYTHTPPAPHVVTPAGTYNVRIYTVDLNTNQVSSLPFTLSVTIK